MKALYYLSYVLSAPFWALSWVCFGVAFGLCAIGGFLHDLTTYRAWLVLHRRECAKR